jgi:hypothetical protein
LSNFGRQGQHVRELATILYFLVQHSFYFASKVLNRIDLPPICTA